MSGKDGNVRLSIIPHDVEEFGAVVKRHGIIMTDVQKFAEEIRNRLQPTLILDDEAA